MSRIWAPLLAALALTECSTTETTGGGGGIIPAVVTPESLKVNVNEIAFDGTTLQVNIDYLDSTPTLVTYVRDASLDIGGYSAYRIQEDALDRLFVALAGESADGSVQAVTVGDGGQINENYAGGSYSRTGVFDRPPVGIGPGAGQVSYAGSYAAVTNVGVTDGATFVGLPVPGGTDPSVIPSQPARISGDIFFNVNFGDNSVNGSIYHRVFADPALSGIILPSVALVRSDIAADGTFLGSAVFYAPPPHDPTGGPPIGTYGGVFGGVDAESIAGLVYLNEFSDEWDTERENGMFVLSVCGPNNPLPICAAVQP